MRHDWAFCYIDQQKRIDLLKEVYGIDAEPMGVDTALFEDWLHQAGFLARKYISQAEKVLIYAQEQKEKGIILSDDQVVIYTDCYLAYYDLDTANRELIKTIQELGINNYSDKERNQIIEETKSRLDPLMKSVKDATVKLAEAISYESRLKWSVYEPGWYADQDINEIYVDFR